MTEKIVHMSKPVEVKQEIKAAAIAPCAPACALISTTCLSGECPSEADQVLVLVRMCQADFDRITCLAHNDGSSSYCTSIGISVPGVQVTTACETTITCTGTCTIPIEFLVDCAPFDCRTAGSIDSNFNATAIAAGRYVWFSSVFTPPNVASVQVFNFTGQTIQFTEGKTLITIVAPDSQVTVYPSSSIIPPSVTFNVTMNRWEIVTRSGLAGNSFLGGVAYLVPAGGLAGGENPVTWAGTFSSPSSFSFNWKWAAAVYTSFPASFPTGYNTLLVKPIDDNSVLPFPYNNSDNAGTPEAYKTFVIGGARGGGGSNYTGSYSGTQNVSCTCG